MKSCDSTQSHAKHKMTNTMKFDVFCSTYRTSKNEILRFYTKSCKAQNDKHHEVWWGSITCAFVGCITMSLVSTLKGKANENDTY
jgi:hypothetical protein